MQDKMRESPKSISLLVEGDVRVSDNGPVRTALKPVGSWKKPHDILLHSGFEAKSQFSSEHVKTFELSPVLAGSPLVEIL